MTMTDRPQPTIDAAMAPDRPAAALVETRRSLHAVAEHVLAAALHDATGRIGLRVAPGGFTTPAFPTPTFPTASGTTPGSRAPGDWCQVGVEGTDIVVRGDLGERRAPLTTIGAAAELVGVDPTTSRVGDVYELATPLDLDAPLAIDAGAALELARFLRIADEALGLLRIDHHRAEPARVQLWPEHFDLGTSFDETNFGASPGDDGHDRPYLYVGPWTPPAPGGRFWNEAFGASLSWNPTTTVGAVVGWYQTGWLEATRPPGDALG